MRMRVIFFLPLNQTAAEEPGEHHRRDPHAAAATAAAAATTTAAPPPPPPAPSAATDPPASTERRLDERPRPGQQAAGKGRPHHRLYRERETSTGGKREVKRNREGEVAVVGSLSSASAHAEEAEE
uniref:Uncharacterized protein n=1 Tax=Larimichthys crocea TaxID=215358 RepID=A0A0F8AMJ1_LARCR